jgi:hypothetical protein
VTNYLCWGCSSFNAHALGALAEVAGPGLSSHIGTILPTLVLAMDNEDEVRGILNTYFRSGLFISHVIIICTLIHNLIHLPIIRNLSSL